ncbi:MAG: trypsin-like peptidase domain-containing protein [Gloeomargarita sp. SKYBB_i_bin120]|nr:trypsin-like peptidase domain-containing protein [Gloeomargarita sp. SKYG98]MCS7292659.1 trypsin-like peptidase domain-containing protein [Gloeomargarita sp. SKYB120]MDW8178221.1 trypsin-like peptidase domain-containing protein [Gloeomargarita sp. SKYBB_i_bin120]
MVWPLLTLTLATTSPLLGISPSTAQSRFAAEERVSIEVYRKASPAVVTIHTGYGNGSGTIISPEGLVLTGEHVVRGFRTVQVITSTGARYRGWVIATDRQRDLALVRLEGVQGPLPTVPLANADGIQVGQRVFAIGSPFGLSGTLTTGILSRIAPNGDLQTDAAINPGNSGGPLLNSRGELIGVNRAILNPAGIGANIGIGFATSILNAREFIAQNRNNPIPKVATPPVPPTPAQGFRLGIALDPETLVIQDVEPNSPAELIGLRPGDRLLALNGRPLEDAEELRAYLQRRPRAMLLTVARQGRIANVLVQF